MPNSNRLTTDKTTIECQVYPTNSVGIPLTPEEESILQGVAVRVAAEFEFDVNRHPQLPGPKDTLAASLASIGR